MPENSVESGRPATPVTGFFRGEYLELNWRYAYRPEYIPLLLNYLGAQSGACILDVGCGSGFLTRMLAKNLDDAQLTGLDADRKMLDLAQQMVERDRLTAQIKLRQGNVYHLPFSDEAFDLVTSQTLL